jgi:ribosome-binding factor A
MRHRRERISQEFRDLVAKIVSERVRDPRLRLLTITDADVAPDLSFARVFYRPLGNPDVVERGLRKAKPFIRRMCGQLGSLRRVPELDFQIDWGVDRGERVERILSEIAAERGPPDSEEES